MPVLELWMMPWLTAAVLAAGIGAFLGYNIALKRNGPVLTSAALTLTPMYAAGLAVLLIGEQLAWYHGAALVLVVAGFCCSSTGHSRPHGLCRRTPCSAPGTCRCACRSNARPTVRTPAGLRCRRLR